MRCLNLESIIQSEVSRKEKNKYCRNLEDGTDEIIFRTAMETQILITDLWTQEVGRKERVGCMKRVSQKLMLLYVEQILNGNLLSDSRNSKRASVTFQRGGMGREVQEGRIICIPMADSCSVWQKSAQFCKAFILQLKKKNIFIFRKIHAKKEKQQLSV